MIDAHEADQTTARVRRVLVVSHACVLPVNQHVYVRLMELGWDVILVVPAVWRHEYENEPFSSDVLEALQGAFLPAKTLMIGRPQRHFYVQRAASTIRRIEPDIVFAEEESFSVAAFQWGLAAAHHHVPFGVQAAENLDRPLPVIARVLRTQTLRRAAFVAARSPSAGDRARAWGARGSVRVVPHAVPEWPQPAHTHTSRPFTIGYAGRLVPEKGLEDLIAAAETVTGPTRLMLVGNGPARADIERAARHLDVVFRTDVRHDEIPAAYGEMDVLVLPSRTTERWAEQFGRVLVEALWCGVPVVGSDSGEIPWVINATGGGRLFREGDVRALAAELNKLRESPLEREALARRGRAAVRGLFSVDAAADALNEVLLDALQNGKRLNDSSSR